MAGRFSSGDSDHVRRLLGVDDAEGNHWCNECASTLLTTGEDEPELVQDIWADGNTWRYRCSQCKRRLKDVPQ